MFAWMGFMLFLCSSLFLPSPLRSATFTVDCEGGGDYLTIQEGINAAVDGDTVLVYRCLYVENIGYGAKDIVVRSVEGPMPTVIQGSSSWYPVVNFYGEYGGEQPDSTAVLEGFTIDCGGITEGVMGHLAHPKIVGNIIRNSPQQGIFFFEGSQPIIRNNVIYDCPIGILISSAYREVKGNIIHRLYGSGTGIQHEAGCIIGPCEWEGNWFLGVQVYGTPDPIEVWWEDRPPTIRNNVLIGDFRTDDQMKSGIVVREGASPEVFDNTVRGFARYGFDTMRSSSTVVNNTFTENGAGVRFWFGDSSTAINNVVVENGTYDYGINCEEAAGEMLGYNDVWGNVYGDYSPGCEPGPGSISEDPLFVDPDRGHYSLQSSSPCIDAGDPLIVDTDGTRSDMGAFGGPDAEAVNLSLYTISGLVVERGDTLRMGAILSNNTQVQQDVTLEVDLYIATGYPYGRNPISGPLPLSLGPLETLTPNLEFEYRVPMGLDPGLYRLIGVVKDGLGKKVDEEFLVYIVE